jgi:hypothetical protein
METEEAARGEAEIIVKRRSSTSFMVEIGTKQNGRDSRRVQFTVSSYLDKDFQEIIVSGSALSAIDCLKDYYGEAKP